MKLNRDFTRIINWGFDNLIPPFLRDSKWFMLIAFYPLFGKKSKYFMEFKEKAPFLNESEFTEYYTLLADKHIKRETSLNKKSLQIIADNILGDKILDIASGNGYLVNYLAKQNPEKHFTGIDIINQCEGHFLTNASFSSGNIENINFGDNYFDVVISTHTLEHVQNINLAIKELRRVASKRLIIVVPCQREYKYTFDLHLHFFPYLFSFQKLMSNTNAQYQIVDNDIVYIEDF